MYHTGFPFPTKYLKVMKTLFNTCTRQECCDYKWHPYYMFHHAYRYNQLELLEKFVHVLDVKDSSAEGKELLKVTGDSSSVIDLISTKCCPDKGSLSTIYYNKGYGTLQKWHNGNTVVDDTKLWRVTVRHNIYRTSSKNSALLIIRHPLPNDGK